MPEGIVNRPYPRMAVVKQLVLVNMLLLIHVSVFFIFAGHISLRLLIYFAASFLHLSLSTLAQWRWNPELLVQRLKMKREGSKLWDEILMRVSNLTALVLVPAVAGLDVGRLHWPLDDHFIVVGLVLIVISSILLNWAMAVNPYFEPTVRVQEDRGHRVVTGGPYKIVRHPGYLAGILYTLSIPLVIGSMFTFVPVGIYTMLMTMRTLLEDRTLHEELMGYAEYAGKVKWRLLPGIW